MFHHFPDELGGTQDYLVRSTDFELTQNPFASFIASITQSGYVKQSDATYLEKSLPKLEFQYTQAQVDETVHDIDESSLRNLPAGVDDALYKWVDLDSEGLTGVLTEQEETWYYKRNLGNGTLGPVEVVARKPLLSRLSGARLVDLTGEGHLDLVQSGGPQAGFFERSSDGGWKSFRPFRSAAKPSTTDTSVRFVDLTGDGLPDNSV
jgi:hypothetical protein